MKCDKCGKQRKCYTLCIDPDIPQPNLCKPCMNEYKMELLTKLYEYKK
jgi:hypothetical protein